MPVISEGVRYPGPTTWRPPSLDPPCPGTTNSYLQAPRRAEEKETVTWKQSSVTPLYSLHSCHSIVLSFVHYIYLTSLLYTLMPRNNQQSPASMGYACLW